MNPRTALASVLVCVAVATVASIAITASAEDPALPPAEIPVDWAERPTSVEELAESSVVVVEAEVVSVDEGDPLVPLDEEDPDGPDSEIPTLEITFQTFSAIKGTPPSTFIVQQTGAESRYLEGDPLYTVGERYVLFIRPQEGDTGFWLPVAPDGRILFEETTPEDPRPEEAILFIEGTIKDELEGATLDEIVEEVEGTL